LSPGEPLFPAGEPPLLVYEYVETPIRAIMSNDFFMGLPDVKLIVKL
jgi:hypothetical protein